MGSNSDPPFQLVPLYKYGKYLYTSCPAFESRLEETTYSPETQKMYPYNFPSRIMWPSLFLEDMFFFPLT